MNVNELKCECHSLGTVAVVSGVVSHTWPVAPELVSVKVNVVIMLRVPLPALVDTYVKTGGRQLDLRGDL